ncbi:MAG: hypothetical protein R3360_08580 [Alphaproteobacteria bacterium]|nr:hypothetical protein [Alphaproteobacteria bacterium]
MLLPGCQSQHKTALAIKVFGLTNQSTRHAAHVLLTDREETGIFEGLDKDGALLLRTSGGELLKISAGDVFFPQSGQGADHAADN